MGPWLIGHGKAHGLRRSRADVQASMGPWLIGHGKTVVGATLAS